MLHPGMDHDAEVAAAEKRGWERGVREAARHAYNVLFDADIDCYWHGVHDSILERAGLAVLPEEEP